MFRNYLNVCFRNLSRNKTYSVFSIIGLAVGIASCLMILQFVAFESSYDQFHSNKDRIFRVDQEYYQNGESQGRFGGSQYQLAPSIQESVPGVVGNVRIHQQYGGAVVTFHGEGDQRQNFEEDEMMYFVDQEFFDFFDYPLLDGNRSTLLTEPMSIVLTESMTKKYIPNVANPVGQFIHVGGGWYPGTYKISGVLADLPGNTLFSFGFLMSIDNVLKNNQYSNDDGWHWANFNSFILIEKNADIQQITELSKNIINERSGEDYETTGNRTNVVFTSLNDIHLRDEGNEANGEITDDTLLFFQIIAIFIISIAWLNHVNLTTAQSLRRAREVGIRKVVGAVRKHLVLQFLIEGFVIYAIAIILALAIWFFSTPILGMILEKRIAFGMGIELFHWLFVGGGFLLGMLLSIYYPAFVMSEFKPLIVVKGTVFMPGRKLRLRQTLVIVQLLIGVFLITGTLTVSKQLRFMRNQDLGFDVEQVMFIRGPKVYDDLNASRQSIITFKDKISSIAAISSISSSNALPGSQPNWSGEMGLEGQDDSQNKPVIMMLVDANFHETYKMELVAGRFHQENIRSDDREVVVNEKLIHVFGLGTPQKAIGKKMRVRNHYLPIIGVIKDFHWYSLHHEQGPMLFDYTQYGRNISIRISNQNIQETISLIRKEYESHFPGNPFDYGFMDDYFGRQYKADRRFFLIFSAFSTIAILIACLGLFGLALFTLKLRVKEIGVRKIIGASTLAVLILILKDYMKLIFVASVLGLPMAYLAIQGWLDNYAYRIPISLDLMILPILMLAMIVLITIGYQVMRTALTNPTTAIRNE